MAKRYLITCSAILIVAVAFIFSPSASPLGALHIPPPSSVLPAPSNAKLQEVIKLGEGALVGPEDVAIDKNGVLYTATRDGYIKRLHKNGTWENWWKIDSGGLLGLAISDDGDDLIVCDAEKGLLTVSEDGFKILASHVNGSKLRFADDVIASSDGTIYFSIATTESGLHDWQLDLLETKSTGQLVKHDPSSNETSVLVYDLGFANGVALSSDQDYLVVCETFKYRCVKYWLQGDLKGKTEIFIENLPGCPDNINLAPDGSFWIALLQVRPGFVFRSRASKHLMRGFPKLRNWIIGLKKQAMVVNVGRDGKIVRGFDDPTGEVMDLVTSAVEFEGHLYFGSLHNDFVGKLPLTTSSY